MASKISPIRLARIPESEFSAYRYDVIFNAYKWDPQVHDQSTVSEYAALISPETAAQLQSWAEKLSEETVMMEEALLQNLPLAKELGLPKEIIKSLKQMTNYDRHRNVRLMRFDFHPTETGWAVSEVNSDVPGGYAEAAVLPHIAKKYFSGCDAHGNIGRSLFEEFSKRLPKGSTIGLVHATSYSDDRQVMQFVSDYFYRNGLNTVFISPDLIKWSEGKAFSMVKGCECPVDGIIRFFPVEWLVNLSSKSIRKGYYNCVTPSCNHPAAILTQSKRLPLIWDKLGVDLSAWKSLLPETKDPQAVNPNDEEWIYKPAFGRVGEGISIKEAVSEKEMNQIKKSAHRYPRDWVAQRRFKSLPLITEASDGQTYHICVGVFTVNGKGAGFYGRISPYPRIDEKAKDIPILVYVSTKGNDDER